MATKSTKDGIKGNKVTTYLTGGKSILGGREKPLVAHEVFCSCDGECPFKKDGQCVCVTSRLMSLSWCPYGKETTTKGYTSRAQKYYSFKRLYEDDPTYGALRGLHNTAYVRLVGDYVYLHLPEPRVTVPSDNDKGKPIGCDGQLRIGNPLFGGTEGWFKRECFDAEAIVAICEFVPYSDWTGKCMVSYQEKTVPAFVEDLRVFWPEMHAKLMTVRPDLCGKEVDYRGRTARIATLRGGITLCDSLGNQFVLSNDRTELRCDDFKNPLVSVGTCTARSTTSVVMPVGEKDTITVDDNDWVIVGETVFM